MASTLQRLSFPTLVAAGVLLTGWQVDAEPNRTTMPDITKLVHYTTVTRGEVTEHIMTTKEAIEAVKAGSPVPDGTHFVLVDYRDGKVFRYFVMEKGAGWGADYEARRRTDDWQFQWFLPDGRVNMAENTARCQSCHSSRSDRQFLYTFNDVRRFEFE